MPKKAKTTQPEIDLSKLARESIIRLPDALRATGESRTSFLRGVKDGRYPQPLQIGKRSIGWRYGDILDIEREQVS